MPIDSERPRVLLGNLEPMVRLGMSEVQRPGQLARIFPSRWRGRGMAAASGPGNRATKARSMQAGMV